MTPNTMGAVTTTSSSAFASSSTSTNSSLLGSPPQEKLTRGNFLLWKAIVLPQIKGAQREHHLDEKSLALPTTLTITKDGKEEQVVNFARSLWYAQQQQLQGYLMGSLSRDILPQKGNMTMAEYLGKIKSLTDEVASIATALSDPEIVSKILAGLDMEYNLVVLALAARVEPITVQELYSHLLSFDACLSLLHGANSASR
ncbi:uncharacterized protein [Aegilops tauschii subsp. strangulata]|uniref:uncharacterized protein n=1 Tax=Aegilops tauschii subsp. strangulata TaxID=200361 RepID=UPI003CC83CB2